MTNRDRQPTGPLAGVRVLDLSSVVSGPMTAMVLADQGADVIKVEPPGWGDGIRYLGATHRGVSAIFCMINRNKRSLALNWKAPAGAALVRRLAAEHDVVLQNYRPGKLERAGLGYADLCVDNPGLIYASISGMGEVGPLAEQKVFDYVIQGISGATDAQGPESPAMIRTIVYDKVTALTAAQAITAALYARSQDPAGNGQHLRLSMLDAALQFNWPELMWNHSFVDDSPAIERAGDLADMYAVSPTSDGAVVSHRLGGDTREYSTDTLMELFATHDVPIARANKRREVASDPQVVASGALEEYAHRRAGRLRQPRSAARFEGTPVGTLHPAPEVGEHTIDIIEELGLTEDEIRDLVTQGALG
ncbi:MAG: CaiB/BaiF CoA-transferase family protein [Pseudomonadota bacterium]